MQNPTDPTLNLDAIAKATAHRAIEQMRAEVERLDQIAYRARREFDDAIEALEEHLVCDGYPSEGRTLPPIFEAIPYIADVASHGVHVEVDINTVDTSVDFVIEHRPVGRDGRTQSIHIAVPAWDYSAVVREAIAEAKVKAVSADEARRAHGEAYAILRDPDFPVRLYGELLSRLVASKMPEVSAIVDQTVDAVRAGRLLTVGGAS